jgi:hypothetical protein
MQVIGNHQIASEELVKRERIIQSGLNTFYAVGIALSEIKEMRLFVATHSSWEDYCRDRWNMAARTAYQTIKSAAVVANLMDGNSATIPASESIARELVAIPKGEQKAAWLEAIAECPDITAAQLKKWLRRRYHIKDGLQKARIVHRCPNCHHEYEPENLAAKSRGNRNPSKTPSLFYSEFGTFETAIDYGCGRLRNAGEIEKGAKSVIYCDLPEQVERLHANGKEVLPVPIDHCADVVFLIQVAHIQRDEQSAAAVVQKAARHVNEYLVIDYPAAQFNHAKEGSGYLRLNDEMIAGWLPGWDIQRARWSGKVNKMLVLRNCAIHPQTRNLLL